MSEGSTHTSTVQRTGGREVKLALFQRIPRKVREVIYDVFAAVMAIELGLDAINAGVIPERPQLIIVTVAGTIGLTVARSNVTGD